MFSKESPIGIIDSGIGGFSVARKVQKLLPRENLVYLGDGANTPYGNHTAEEILTMTRYMLRFMEEKGVKALLVACNTISCLIDQYRDEMSCPVLSVVQAGADAVKDLDVHKVGVISTCFTASTHCYPDLIGKAAPDKVVISHGCPDLANVVERNVGRPEGQALIDADVQKNLEGLVRDEQIECCVLGCTHYPLLEEVIGACMGPEVRLINSGAEGARAAADCLRERDALAGPGRGSCRCFVSDRQEDFSRLASTFLGWDVAQAVEQVDISQY